MGFVGVVVMRTPESTQATCNVLGNSPGSSNASADTAWSAKLVSRDGDARLTTAFWPQNIDWTS
jgi:hypothetical protein